MELKEIIEALEEALAFSEFDVGVLGLRSEIQGIVDKLKTEQTKKKGQ